MQRLGGDVELDLGRLLLLGIENRVPVLVGGRIEDEEGEPVLVAPNTPHPRFDPKGRIYSDAEGDLLPAEERLGRQRTPGRGVTDQGRGEGSKARRRATVASVWIAKRQSGAGVRYRVMFRTDGRGAPPRYAGSFRTMKEARFRRDWLRASSRRCVFLICACSRRGPRPADARRPGAARRESRVDVVEPPTSGSSSGHSYSPRIQRARRAPA